MQLLRLRLVNFRQHADTELEFGPGITGIIGPNGSGKTSILEAIAWALYGVQAVRGDKDSIRRLGAKGRAGVEVDLEFRLGAHEYRVKRGLSAAVLHQDGQVIANSLKAVTDKLERTLGMSHDEFLHLLHGPKGVGRDGGTRQDGAGGVPVARARVRAPARGGGAGAGSTQRGGGGGAGSRGRPPRRRGARRGAAGRGTATERGPQVGQERGRGAAGRGGRAGSGRAALERVDGAPRAHAVARRRAAYGGAGGGVVAPGIPTARQGARGRARCPGAAARARRRARARGPAEAGGRGARRAAA